MSNEAILNASTVRKIKSLVSLAPLAGMASADAADFFNSGTVNQTVGWVNGTLQSSEFTFNLRSGGFKVGAIAITKQSGTTFTWRVNLGSADQSGFALATYERPAGGGYGPLLNAGKLFDANAQWGTPQNNNLSALAGSLAISKIVTTVSGVDSTITNRNTYGKLSQNVTNKYLLFKFTDEGDDYFGWVQVVQANEWVADDPNNYVTVIAYAWQKGVIDAGVQAVPEPSTVVTSGIAALAGGAVALRRWRKERKAKTDAA